MYQSEVGQDRKDQGNGVYVGEGVLTMTHIKRILREPTEEMTEAGYQACGSGVGAYRAFQA
jgi:hypothetical protein